MSGGGPLNTDIGTFFLALGVRLLQGYGLTETAPVVSCNPPNAIRIRTVGPALPGVDVKIADDGEILVRGELTMDGYWNDPVATAASLKDGWVHTGDIGRIDDDGYIQITDRKKDIIVMSGGDNVAPQRIEGMLCFEPEIGQAMVHGDGHAHLVAILVPEESWQREFASAHGKDPKLLFDDTEFHDAISTAVDRVNARLSQIEKVRGFIVADAPFTTENAMLTPSLKIRRHMIRERYGRELAGPLRPRPGGVAGPAPSTPMVFPIAHHDDPARYAEPLYRRSWTQDEIVAMFPADGIDVLDVGAGANPLACRSIDRLVTIDFDRHTDQSFVCDFTQQWPVERASVDFAYASHVLEHLYHQDRDRLIMNIHDSLRPGGMLFVRVPHWSSIQGTGWEHYTLFGLNGLTSLTHGPQPHAAPVRHDQRRHLHGRCGPLPGAAFGLATGQRARSEPVVPGDRRRPVLLGRRRAGSPVPAAQADRDDGPLNQAGGFARLRRAAGLEGRSCCSSWRLISGT